MCCNGALQQPPRAASCDMSSEVELQQLQLRHTALSYVAPDEELHLDRLIEEISELQAEEDHLLDGRLSQDMKEAEAVLDSVLAEGERMTSGLSRRASSLDSDHAASRCYDADSWDRSRRVGCHSRMPQSDATLYWDNSRMPRGSPALGDRCEQLDTSDQLLADRERMRAARKRATKGKQPLSSASSTRSRRASEGSHGGLQAEREIRQREIMRAARRAADPKRRLRAERERMRAARRAMRVRGEGGIQTAIV